MKKTVALLVLMMLVPCGARGGGKGVLRLMGRTARSMVMPWRYPREFAGNWLIVAAVAADARSTNDGLRKCRGCRETFPLLGARPSRGRVWGTLLPISFTYAMANQFVNEQAIGLREPTRELFGFATPAMVAVGHGTAARHNYRVLEGCEQARCR